MTPLAGMLVAIALATIAACESGTERAELERRAERLEAELVELRARVFASEAAAKRALTEQLADMGERLRWAGITDDEGRAVIRWWCLDAWERQGAGLCYRTEAQCAAARKRYDWAAAGGCRGRRVAWCEDRRNPDCTGSPSTCMPAGTCRGVE